MVKVRAHIFVSGKVQGVFFRQKTRQQAENLGVKGWVKNLDDGKVEAVFEGEKEEVETLVAFCKKGPKGAIVKGFKLDWEEFSGEFDDFEVVY